MHTTQPFNKLIAKLASDPAYLALDDRYDKMRYFVDRRAKQLHKYGDHVLEQCAKYQKENDKSWSKTKQYADKLWEVYARFADDPDQVSLDEYRMFRRTCSQALLYYPMDWQNLATMIGMLRIYLARGVLSYYFERYTDSRSDLNHARAILLEYSNPEECREHFVAADSDLLIVMVRLYFQLFDQLKGPEGGLVRDNLPKPPPLDASIESRQDVNHVFELLNELGLLFEEYDKLYHKATTQEKPKVNYEISPKIRLMQCETDGRHFEATEHVAKDEKLMFEKALSVVHFYKHLYTHCTYCHRDLNTFWPCEKCTDVVFCSSACYRAAYREYHHLECGIHGYLLGSDIYAAVHLYRMVATFGLSAMLQCEDEEAAKEFHGGAPFEPDKYYRKGTLQSKNLAAMSKTERKVLYQALSSLLHHRGKRDATKESFFTVIGVMVAHCLMYKGVLKREIAQDLGVYARLLENFATVMLRVCNNGFCWGVDGDKGEYFRVGSCLFYTASLINHSCNPNVHWDICDGTIRMRAMRQIVAGEQLTTCYGPMYYQRFSERQDRLYHNYCFYCQCEMCFKDAADEQDTLRCTNGECTGPVVRNIFGACLSCGFRMPKSDSERRATLVANSSNKFMRIIWQIYPDHDKRFKFVTCLMPERFSKVTGKDLIKPDTFTGDDYGGQQNVLSKKTQAVKAKKLNKINITKLQKALATYTSVVYGASYYLLEKCVLMLKVYHDSNQLKDGLQLISQLNRCLEHITPSVVDKSHPELIYYLDYAAYFFEKFATVHSNQIPCNKVTNSDGSCVKQSQVTAKAAFWGTMARLNTKLVAILTYDLEHRGDFFPATHARMLTIVRGQDEETAEQSRQELENSLDEVELYYRQVFIQAQSRLSHIEMMLNA